MPTSNAYKAIEEQKTTKDSPPPPHAILDLEDLDTLPLPHLAHSQTRSKKNLRVFIQCPRTLIEQYGRLGMATRQHEGRSQPVWRRTGAGGESEVEARRGTRSNPRTPTGSTPRRSSPHSSHWRDGWGRRWVRARAAKPSAHWQMFCAMGACTRDSVARPRCLPGRAASWPPPPRLSRASRA
ncbi:hypothetical protein B0H14DRAFT_2752849 [Mycena olivaceomarginata]|nr:hypothetical protein B0H14DRAFT_2752849 [Mycena olivaceomarginata]